MERNEQWLRGGDCSICRREKYCSKPCKCAMNRQSAELAGRVAGLAMHAMTKTIAKGVTKRTE